MSKIALIAATASAVDHWRRASGIGPELAPWVVAVGQIQTLGPFASVLCMTGWRDLTSNVELYEHLVRIIAPTRRTLESRSTAEAVEEALDLAEDFAREDAARRPHRPGAEQAFPSVPPMSENERVLRDFGVNPGLIGMLGDETQNQLARRIERRQELDDVRGVIETVARNRHIRPWAPSDAHGLAPSESLRFAIETVESFYGTNAHFQTMSPERLVRCVTTARRGNSASQVFNLPEVVAECRDTIRRILEEHQAEQTDAEAGFLPESNDGVALVSTAHPDLESGPPAERTPGDGYDEPAYRTRPRVYSDPLRDHLRTFMQTQRRTPRSRFND